MSLFPDRAAVSTREELIALIFDLLDHNDAIEWRNETVYPYLQAIAAWLRDAEGFYQELGEGRSADEASWQLFADALQAGAGSP